MEQNTGLHALGSDVTVCTDEVVQGHVLNLLHKTQNPRVRTRFLSIQSVVVNLSLDLWECGSIFLCASLGSHNALLRVRKLIRNCELGFSRPSRIQKKQVASTLTSTMETWIMLMPPCRPFILCQTLAFCRHLPLTRSFVIEESNAMPHAALTLAANLCILGMT